MTIRPSVALFALLVGTTVALFFGIPHLDTYQRAFGTLALVFFYALVVALALFENDERHLEEEWAKSGKWTRAKFDGESKVWP